MSSTEQPDAALHLGQGAGWGAREAAASPGDAAQVNLRLVAHVGDACTIGGPNVRGG